MSPAFEQSLYDAGLTAQGSWDCLDEYDRAAIERFGVLVVWDIVRILREEWCELNNLVPPKDESTRDCALRVGRKNEVLQLVNKITQRYESAYRSL